MQLIRDVGYLAKHTTLSEQALSACRKMYLDTAEVERDIQPIRFNQGNRTFLCRAHYCNDDILINIETNAGFEEVYFLLPKGLDKDACRVHLKRLSNKSKPMKLLQPVPFGGELKWLPLD